MTRVNSLLTAGVLLASCAIAASSGAGILGKDYITTNRATALPGVVLPAGDYAFEAVEGHPDIVRVTNRAQKRVVYMGFTDLIDRPSGVASNKALLLGEAPSGEPLPITAWFPTGARRGNVFKHR